MTNPLVNPVGPEEPSVYWRRRAVLGVILLVVVWLMWLAVSALTGGANASASEPKPGPSFGLSLSDTASPDASSPADDESPGPSASGTDPSASPASAGPTDSQSASASASAAASDSAAPSASATTSPAGGSCDAGDVVVAAQAASQSPKVGAGTSFTLSVTNKGSSACTRDVGPGANELRLTSGGTLAWSSDHCNPSTAAKVVTLEPGQPWSTTLTWNGNRSKAGCGAAQAAPAGSYQLIATNGSTSSEPVTLTVS